MVDTVIGIDYYSKTNKELIGRNEDAIEMCQTQMESFYNDIEKGKKGNAHKELIMKAMNRKYNKIVDNVNKTYENMWDMAYKCFKQNDYNFRNMLRNGSATHNIVNIFHFICKELTKYTKSAEDKEKTLDHVNNQLSIYQTLYHDAMIKEIRDGKDTLYDNEKVLCDLSDMNGFRVHRCCDCYKHLCESDYWYKWKLSDDFVELIVTHPLYKNEYKEYYKETIGYDCYNAKEKFITNRFCGDMLDDLQNFRNRNIHWDKFNVDYIPHYNDDNLDSIKFMRCNSCWKEDYYDFGEKRKNKPNEDKYIYSRLLRDISQDEMEGNGCDSDSDSE